MDPQLVLDLILGTSAKSPHHVVVQDNVLAYTTSGGVVVCTVDTAAKSIAAQRFFCANASLTSHELVSSANAYLNLALALEPPEETKRDDYGWPLLDPIVVASASDTTKLSPSKLKDKVRSISCLALSPNKRVLAVGETGYRPRILLYSLAPNSSENPVALIYEHQFGIAGVEFSPCLKYLCSLGIANDGFVNVWKYTPSAVSLHATNKCSSIINYIVWHDDYIVMLGLRLIKVWQLDGSKTLRGKNVLLGNLIHCNFVTGHALNSDEILVLSSTGQLLLLSTKSLKLVPLDTPAFESKLVPLDTPSVVLHNVLVDYHAETVWFSEGSSLVSVAIDNLKSSSAPPSPASPSKHRHRKDPESHITKLADAGAFVLYLASEEIRLHNKSTHEEHVLVHSLLNNLAGVKATQNMVLAFSQDGEVKRIDKLEHLVSFQVPQGDFLHNTLTAVDASPNQMFLGDKYGHLFVLNSDDKSTCFKVKAHASSINDLVYFSIEQHEFACSISRDRTIQIFHRGNTWEVLQTLVCHTGNLLKVVYCNNRVYVCALDRTVSVHRITIVDDKVVVEQEKMIRLKNSPTNMRIFGDDLVVSSSDRVLFVYLVSENHELKRSLKLYDKNNESLMVEDFIVQDRHIIVSCSDKSLRVFEYASGKPVTVVWGHLDAVLTLFTHNDLIYSVGADGCAFTWHLEVKPNQVDAPTQSDQENLPLYSKVTRKILPPSTPSSPRRPNVAEHDGPTRVSTATLKRIEARKNSEPSPKITVGETPALHRPRPGLLSRLLSPIRASSPSRAPSSPSRALALPVRPSRTASLNGSPKSLSRKPLLDLRKPMQSEDDVLDKAIAYLTIIKSQLPQLKPDDKRILRDEVAELLHLLDGQDKVLEHYSDKLLEMFQAKLGLGN